MTLSLLQMNRPEWFFITIGFLVSCLNGAREPGYTFIQTKLTMVNDNSRVLRNTFHVP